MKRILLAGLLLSSVAVHRAPAQSDRDRAIQLYNSGKQVEALPLLAKAAAADSNDREVLTRYAFALVANSKLLPDSMARRLERAHGRAVMMRVQTLGTTDPMVATFLRAIPPDGGHDPSYSPNKEVDAAMQRAEKAFTGGDMTGAVAGYKEALALDPTQYSAALFLGDAYNGLKQLDSSLAWYHRAIAINPARETAHRYMADVLIKNHRLDEARDEAIEAIVIEPFNRLARGALSSWAQASRTPTSIPVVAIPPRDTTMHSKATAAYDSVRRAWRGTPGVRSAAFAAAYPGDTVYRHSLQEEMAALKAAAASGDSTLSTDNIRHLADAGELEAFIFFTRATEGNHYDFPAYAKDHHEALVRFWTDFVIGAKYVK